MSVTIKDLIRDFVYKDVLEETLVYDVNDKERDEIEERLDTLIEMIKTYFD